MSHSPNDAVPLETILLYVVIFSESHSRLRPVYGYRLQHRDLRPLLAYSTGSVHTQIKLFNKTTVENRVYFALFLLRLHLNYLFRQKLQPPQINLH